jgi:hypothetical protein
MLSIMEKLIILRMFLCFPLFGSILPEVGIWLSNRSEGIPLIHLIIEATLLIFVAICSLRIYILKKRNKNAAKMSIVD